MWLRCCFHMPETRAKSGSDNQVWDSTSSRRVSYRHLFLLQYNIRSPLQCPQLPSRTCITTIMLKIGLSGTLP
jgi:hypothetical protein